MSKLHVLVAATRRDIEAEGIAAAVEACVDMTLAAGRVLAPEEVDGLLPEMPCSPCALVMIGIRGDVDDAMQRWLSQRSGLVVVRIDITDDLVEFAVRDLGLDSLLAALRRLAGRSGSPPAERLSRIACHCIP